MVFKLYYGEINDQTLVGLIVHEGTQVDAGKIRQAIGKNYVQNLR